MTNVIAGKVQNQNEKYYSQKEDPSKLVLFFFVNNYIPLPE